MLTLKFRRNFHGYFLMSEDMQMFCSSVLCQLLIASGKIHGQENFTLIHNQKGSFGKSKSLWNLLKDRGLCIQYHMS